MASPLRSPEAILAVFVATLFIGALQLFAVQPMFARLVLPLLGGATSVWAVAMCFFQAVLLAGYVYAHLLERWLRPGMALTVHAAVLLAATLSLPIRIPSGWSEPPAGDAYLWLIGLMTAGVGLPFFALSATAPLLQAWFSRTGHAHSRDPYFLYGASNLGSLAALVAYPALLEPSLGLASQGRLWGAGFIVLALLVLACGGVMLTARGTAPDVLSSAEQPSAGNEPGAQRTLISWAARLHWLLLAFVPSALIIAVTNHITTDIASTPFLWVIPLALFLLTFVLVFKDRPVVPHEVALILQPLATAFVLGTISTDWDTRLLVGSGAAVVAFFVTALVCHRELYVRRPNVAGLTEFYIWMSLGGVLGGVFSSLVAPQVFSSVAEFPILLLLGLACRPAVASRLFGLRDWRWTGPALVVGIAVLYGLRQLWLKQIWTGKPSFGALVLLAIGVLILAAWLWRPRLEAALAGLMGASLLVVPPVTESGSTVRSFYGVYRISDTYEGDFRLLQHGTTVHGATRLRDADGKPPEQKVAISYYYDQSTMARGVELARRAKGEGDVPVRFGVVGLGTGAMACHGIEGDTVRFFEIDPAMVRIAQDPDKFGFLSECFPAAEIVLGDARLSIAKEQPASFDYLVIDAFSSDAIPVHLLTLEAVRLYLDKLTDKGVLALHISNRHLDLESVVAALLPSLPGISALYVDDQDADGSYDQMRSDVVLLAKDRSVLEPGLEWNKAQWLEPVATRPWTDDYSGVFQAFLKRYWR